MQYRTPALKEAINGLCDDPYENGQTIFENEDAKGPFDGDYLLVFIDEGYVYRARHYVDRKHMVVCVVAVVKPQKLFMG